MAHIPTIQKSCLGIDLGNDCSLPNGTVYKSVEVPFSYTVETFYNASSFLDKLEESLLDILGNKLLTPTKCRRRNLGICSTPSDQVLETCRPGVPSNYCFVIDGYITIIIDDDRKQNDTMNEIIGSTKDVMDNNELSDRLDDIDPLVVNVSFEENENPIISGVVASSAIFDSSGSSEAGVTTVKTNNTTMVYGIVGCVAAFLLLSICLLRKKKESSVERTSMEINVEDPNPGISLYPACSKDSDTFIGADSNDSGDTTIGTDLTTNVEVNFERANLEFSIGGSNESGQSIVADFKDLGHSPTVMNVRQCRSATCTNCNIGRHTNFIPAPQLSNQIDVSLGSESDIASPPLSPSSAGSEDFWFGRFPVKKLRTEY